MKRAILFFCAAFLVGYVYLFEEPTVTLLPPGLPPYVSTLPQVNMIPASEWEKMNEPTTTPFLGTLERRNGRNVYTDKDKLFSFSFSDFFLISHTEGDYVVVSQLKNRNAGTEVPLLTFRYSTGTVDSVATVERESISRDSDSVTLVSDGWVTVAGIRSRQIVYDWLESVRSKYIIIPHRNGLLIVRSDGTVTEFNEVINTIKFLR